MKGFGTDEQAIIDILTARTNAQRQEIATYFIGEYGRDLIKDLKSELGGKFEDVIIGLMLPATQYLCKQLNKAMSGIGTNESTLVEILCTKNNEEVKQLVKAYEDSKLLVLHVFFLQLRFIFQCTIVHWPNTFAASRQVISVGY